MKKQSKNKAVRYFFCISLVFHAVLLVYMGRSILTRRSVQKIEVDLKSLSAPAPARSIPRPYSRPRAAPQTNLIKSAIKSLAPRPIFSQSPIKAVEKEKTFSPQAVEKIYSPLDASLSQAATLSGQAAFGVVGQIQAIDIPQSPPPIKVASDTFDHTLAYQGIIRQHIEKHKHFPQLAVRKGLEGRVGLRFRLFRDGHVEQIEVAKSSHFFLLDEAAIQAVRAGNPFPPFPEGISQNSIVIESTLSFELLKR